MFFKFFFCWQPMMMQQNGLQGAFTIGITFGTNENKVTSFFVNLIYVLKPRNPLKT